MIISTRYSGPTNSTGSKIHVKAGDYVASFGYYDLIGDDGSTYAHRSAAIRMLALLGLDTEGPVLVDAGEEPRGQRFAVLNGPASRRVAAEKAEALGVAADALLCPVRLFTPMVPEDGERVRLSPGFWPSLGQYATIVKREGRQGVWFKVRSEATGRTAKVTRGAIL